jgi:uncharacterized membrane protein YccC
VVKFGLMVQISDLWQFLLFLFPLLTTMQLLKLQMPKLAGLWGQLIVFMGSFISVTNPPVYDYADFLNDNLAKILGVGWRGWLCGAASRLRCAQKPQAYPGVTPGFVDQLSRKPHLRESEYESLVYHHVSQLNNSQDALPPLAAALGRGAVELFARGLAASRVGNAFRSAVAGA